MNLASFDTNILEKASRKDLLDILSLTENWASEEDCKFYLYIPNDIPRYFHASPAKTRFLGGGNRSSKTYTHVEDYACQFVGKAPKALEGIIPEHRLDQTRKLRFCMEDHPNSFQKVVWPYIQALVPDHTIKDVVKDSGRVRAITNEKGGFIEFMYYDQEVTKHQGTSRNSVGYDEEPPPSIRDEGLMRLVDTDGEESFSLTPLSGSMNFLYDDIYEKRGREIEKNYDLIFNETGKIIDAVEGAIVDRTIPGGDPDIDVFFACIFDNKIISKKAAIRILNKFSKDEQVVRSKGHFLFRSGLVYKEYSDTTHLIPSNNIEWVGDPDYTLYLAIDPHPRTPHAVLFLCVRRDGLMFIVDELFIDCGSKQLAEAIKIKCGNKRPELIICDPLAWTPDPINKSCLAWSLMDDLSICGVDAPLIKSSKDLSNGIIETRKVFSLNDRKVPGIYVTDNCTRFRYEISHWSWDDWKKDTAIVRGAKQKPMDKDDHMMENLYRLVLLQPAWKEPKLTELKFPPQSVEVGRSTTTGY